MLAIPGEHRSIQMTDFSRIVVLTGAGLSAESGLGTFRDVDGVWTKYDLNEVATPEGYSRNPKLVLDFYNMRRQGVVSAEHNAAHAALARLEHEHNAEVLIVTQNIDALHEAAGSQNLIHMHGELLKARCTRCGARHPWHEDIAVDSHCPACGELGTMRPDVVWFGEMPYRMQEIYDALAKTDLFISVGTSGTVYPAAGFVAEARDAGAHTVELNLEPSEGASLFAETVHGPATEVVPAYVDQLLGS